MNHYFDVEIAEKYSINAAVILQNLAHWIQKNEANDVNYYDGDYWTYNSNKAFAELFPYLSSKQIRTALEMLIDDGVIITGNYNKSTYDRTLWYTLTDKGRDILHLAPKANGNAQKDKSICLQGQMEMPKKANGNAPEGEPIPNINTDYKNSNKKTDNKKAAPLAAEEIVGYLNQRAGTNYQARSKDTQKHINARLSEGHSVEDFKTVIDKKCAEWIGTQFEQFLRPSTLFGPKFEGYLNQRTAKPTIGANGIEIASRSEPDILDEFF